MTKLLTFQNNHLEKHPVYVYFMHTSVFSNFVSFSPNQPHTENMKQIGNRIFVACIFKENKPMKIWISKLNFTFLSEERTFQKEESKKKTCPSIAENRKNSMSKTSRNNGTFFPFLNNYKNTKKNSRNARRRNSKFVVIFTKQMPK